MASTSLSFTVRLARVRLVTVNSTEPSTRRGSAHQSRSVRSVTVQPSGPREPPTALPMVEPASESTISNGTPVSPPPPPAPPLDAAVDEEASDDDDELAPSP